jgi:TPP-dependent pyruvate/acetoin dehydrogenase alpha subunit
VSTVAEFQIEHLRYLNPQGRPLRELPAFAHDEAELIRMFAEMLRARLFDAKAIAAGIPGVQSLRICRRTNAVESRES